MTTDTVFMILFCVCSKVESPAKFIVSEIVKVSVLMNLLNVTVFQTEIKDKRAKLMFLPQSK